MPKVIFQIEGAAEVIAECNAGDNLLELARRANVAIDAPCSGNGSCGKCRVKLVEGELDYIPSRHITDEEYHAGWRLSCNSKVISDCTVFVPDIASAYQSRMKTADLSSPKEIAIFEACQAQMQENGIAFENNFRSLVLQLAEPTLDDTMPDNERLTWGIKAQLEVEQVHIPFAVMVKLAHTLREHDFHVCVKGRHDGDTFYCMEICDPVDTAIVGCAIDIGTTTVTMVLTDLNSGKLLAKGSSGNGQIRYGADVINRIIQQGRPGGKKKLQDAIIKETLNPIIANLCKTAGISARSILRLCVGANTTMNHLLVGYSGSHLHSSFLLAHLGQLLLILDNIRLLHWSNSQLAIIEHNRIFVVGELRLEPVSNILVRTCHSSGSGLDSLEHFQKLVSVLVCADVLLHILVGEAGIRAGRLLLTTRYNDLVHAGEVPADALHDFVLLCAVLGSGSRKLVVHDNGVGGENDLVAVLSGLGSQVGIHSHFSFQFSTFIFALLTFFRNFVAL